MTTLIKNVYLIEGSGIKPAKADVLIKDEKIIAVGSFPTHKADKVINGNESYLTPGFIDPDITSDRYLTLFTNPIHENFIRQGITSGLIGQCGFSLAPNFYGEMPHISNWAYTNKINMNWKNTEEFLDSLSSMKVGINLGTFVGHGAIRDNIIKEKDSKFRKLSANELRVFRLILERAIKNGAFGLSSGLGHSRYEETPYHEIRALLDVVKKYKGIYATHLRDEKGGLLKSVEETIKIAKEMSIPTIITHLRPFSGFEDDYEKTLKKISEATSHSEIYFNINPFDSSAESITGLIPKKFKESNKQLFLEKLEDKAFASKLSKEIPKINAKKSFILNAPEMQFLNGKSISEFAKNRNMTTNNAIVNLMKTSKLRATILYNNLDEDLSKKAMLNERALISTNGPSFDNIENNLDKIPDRAIKTIKTFIDIADKSGMRIESAIEKLSYLPAKIFKIKDRGRIARGMYADINILDKDFNVSSVMINGKFVLENGEIKDIKKDTAKAIKFYNK